MAGPSLRNWAAPMPICFQQALSLYPKRMQLLAGLSTCEAIYGAWVCFVPSCLIQVLSVIAAVAALRCRKRRTRSRSWIVCVAQSAALILVAWAAVFPLKARSLQSDKWVSLARK